jgi:hypothetical protein
MLCPAAFVYQGCAMRSPQGMFDFWKCLPRFVSALSRDYAGHASPCGLFYQGCAMRSPQGEAWRRGELNPRPHKRHYSFYARVSSLNLAMPTADEQAIGMTSAHEMVSLLCPGTQHRN